MMFREGQAPPLQTHHTQKSAVPTTIAKNNNPSKIAITLGSLAKGSWIATRLLLIINCLALRFKHL